MEQYGNDELVRVDNGQVKPQPQADTLSIDKLNSQERARAMALVKDLNLGDANAVMEYAAGSQAKVAQTSDTMLANVSTKDLGAIGKSLTDLVVEIKGFDASGEKRGLFGRIKASIEKMAAGYRKVEGNVDRIVSVLEGHKRQMFKDLAMLDAVYAANYEYFKEITLYIIAGKEKLREFTEVTIPEQRRVAETTNDEMEIQKLNDMVASANRFEKRLHDLMLTRTISIQLAPQIRLLQNNDQTLAEKIQSSIVNTIPLWKNQMVIALGLANSKAALDAQRQVTDMTNELLQKNSELLRQGSVEIAREAERGIVSIETVRKTNENLIATINEVLDIQQKGSAERRAAEVELSNMEQQLKTTLLEANRRNM